MQSNMKPMAELSYFTTRLTSLTEHLEKPLRTDGCILLFCMGGRAVVESNFTTMPFRHGDIAVIFFDTLFSVTRISPDFQVRYFELSETFTDDTTITSSGALFDLIYDHPVFSVPRDKWAHLSLWLRMMDWIDSNTEQKYRSQMLRNQWQNFFLGLESVLQHRLSERDTKSVCSGRHIFNGFCKLLSENCRTHHEVKFYADKLCITPYYLSRITSRTFGVSPKELIDRQIIMEIKALLTSTKMTIKEIADLYHFESSSYLGRFFRRHIGMTPSQYRDLHFLTSQRKSPSPTPKAKQ